MGLLRRSTNGCRSTDKDKFLSTALTPEVGAFLYKNLKPPYIPTHLVPILYTMGHNFACIIEPWIY
jgi:hypothetical protein